ncbi:MAG: hypothetical protein EOP34_04205 [Rickettsiales bacterium]|nr:MAG: hypothetical protein EOP34_04205 [Rickettsiales bacterium]
MKILNEILFDSKQLKQIYLPIILRIENFADRNVYISLLEKNMVSFVNDEIYEQLKELIKIENPSKSFNEDDLEKLIFKHIKDTKLEEYGVWVYYPWIKHLVHTLDEEEFIKVRTNRNQHKITSEEQEVLNKKKIGIIGLSVGHSVALTLAVERVCGELRLADFDTIELSNLNRIRTGVKHIGIKKAIVVAREVSEIDPFIKIKIYEEGINNYNLHNFLCEEGHIDILVEVCDNISIKIESRYAAKKSKICVLMDTNDRGMLDIERFDLNSSLEILHGLLGKDEIKTHNISNEEKWSYISKILDIENISEQLKFSIQEIGKSIRAWPQLASSTTLGGAVTTDIARKILLKKHFISGRFYIDLDELVSL